ncbi:hypothetical protein G6F17_011002 [Rhizopus arrhizus]|nr:hypothetical protein G6F22_008679 [Rhizopus arrhizus]KAG0789081.1 hypothetical protein G6F21_006754 [Rhizopus arrhizus]KAG0812499.1 hypothetical protein G6F20_006308 [Rhizopus arrhizus]KAG0831949.1 hypothetical protein G6F19_006483 [Rhizopus arrhizus]KAG0849173.1 hypothetical protein G6F17_011002 [Rhizopus arrhizus]
MIIGNVAVTTNCIGWKNHVPLYSWTLVWNVPRLQETCYARKPQPLPQASTMIMQTLTQTTTRAWLPLPLLHQPSRIKSIPSSPIPTTSSTTTPLDTIATTTEAPPRFPWLIGDFDVADAFYRCRCHVIQQAKDSLLQIEKSVHELSLSHILLLCSNQHSDTMLYFFDQV